MAAPPTSPFVVLPSSHARAHDTFPASDELAQLLQEQIRGEVRFDPASKALYSTDASNYRHIPIGVVLPRDEADVIATVALCRRFNAPILTRGAGTSLAGQGCNAAVILDFSKYMNGMGEIDTVNRTIHVQPGIVLDRVRDAAEKLHLTFAPDPATHSRCTIGGMIGNNSCGVHGLMGGKTVDNIATLDLLLYDGTRLTVGPTTEAELADHIATGGRIGEIYATLKSLRDTYASQVREKFPNIPRRVSGFNLDELLPENSFNVARALVGSEGTCAIILGATLQLVQSPPCRTLVGVGFPDIFLAADHVPQILEHKPIGFEGMDGLLLDAMRRKQKFSEELALLPGGNGFLIVEFGADTQAEANTKARALVASLRTIAPDATSRIYTSAEAKNVWRIRESALGATAFIPGVGTGWEGWEDAAVDPHQLGSYLRAIFALMNEFGYRSPMYGHFGQGCVHMRHNFDLQTEAGILKFRQFMDHATDIALAHGGSLSGEHGDGQARGALLPKMFGEELMNAFRTFKRLFDPTNRMNPNKLIDAHQPHEDLRLGADYNPWQPKTHFAYAENNGSFADANLRCVGVGACRKTDAGTMCPSFMATGEELHSTRGRAHLLWELMQGEVLPDQWKNKQVKESLDLCLACKACKSECPVSVDMATYKSEFLAHHYEGESRPLSHYAFGRIDVFARLASYAPHLVNAINHTPLISAVMKKILHIHPQRTFPRFSKPFTPDRRLARDPKRRRDRRNPLPAEAPEVFLWADTFNNYFHPAAMRAAHQVLTTAGFRVTLPTQHLCCGRPLYDFGMLDTAKDYLFKTLNALTPQLQAGTPIVVLEPSCASVFRDELTNLLPHDPRAQKLRDQTFLLSEFLVKHAPTYRPPQLAEKILVHGHCHHRATMGMHDEIALLRLTGADVELLDSGCCGMAGPFGFEKDKYDVSQTLANRVLLPAVRNKSASTILVTDGFSCAEQITQNTKAKPLHLAEVLALSKSD
ncbi:FAD-binding and (Fe-S)-binding domain-containing protein [Tunturiibacter empetritectus]|uniref:FAD/FMN-containing dehydrogenase/Fe-S oxidoreductase n=1 Tax=Tunturiibacter lichenicola TaxID=2051959 RepID=A0A852VFT3_9BACT|nr:FAD-binding and (Fe-S)-binding domain-containing protein [Edaphobacter lichenicola]NYF91698.1 FAD/FMN-containing dehydrogenase/Fe-S oxidoreductase [Edaphobacter lichenicola]